MLLGNAQEKSPTLFVDGTPIAFESDISLPYWLSEGKTVEFGVHVISLSILEFNAVDNELQFNQVIHLTSSGSVPSSKVWKIEALGIGLLMTPLFRPTVFQLQKHQQYLPHQ